MKRTIALLVIACIALTLADLAYHKHGHYPTEELFGFFPAFGFLACAAFALTARILSFVTRRDGDFWDEDRGSER